MRRSGLSPLECHREIKKLYRRLRGANIGNLKGPQIRKKWTRIVEALGSEVVIKESEEWIRNNTSLKWARSHKNAIERLISHLSKLIRDEEDVLTNRKNETLPNAHYGSIANNRNQSQSIANNRNQSQIIANFTPLEPPNSLVYIPHGDVSDWSFRRLVGGKEIELINKSGTKPTADTERLAWNAGNDESKPALPSWVAGSFEGDDFNPEKVYDEIFNIWAKRVGSPFGPCDLEKFPKTFAAWCEIVHRHGKKKILRALGFWLEDNESRLSDPRYKYPVSVFVFEAENYIATADAYYAAHVYGEYVDVDGVKVPKSVAENFKRSKRELDELYERKKREKYEREVWQVWQWEIHRRHGLAWAPELTPENQKELDDCYAVAELVIQKLWERRGIVWNPPSSDDWWREVEKIRAEIGEAESRVKAE